jgi:hypothetical protein
VDYPDYVRALRATHPDLSAELAAFRGLSGVMGWMRGRGLPLSGVEIVQQDECNLDFIVPFDPAGERLVFGIT